MKLGGGNVSIVQASCRDYGQTEVRRGRRLVTRSQ